MNVLSLFDGISCGQLALAKSGIKVDKYFASEIDEQTIKNTQKHFPNTIQLGDVTKVKGSSLPNIDILLGGSPCQSFSKCGDGTGFKGKSSLFFEYVRVLSEVDPKYFLFENVKMKNEWRDIISSYLGVSPLLINSNKYSAQNRQRYYWTNIPQKDSSFNVSGELIQDVLEEDPCPSLSLTENKIIDNNLLRFTQDKEVFCFTEARTEEAKKQRRLVRRREGRDYCTRRGKEMIPRKDGKSNCLTATFSIKEHTVKDVQGNLRKLSPLEWERLQTLPDNYTEGIKNRYKAIGNGWTVDVIVELIRGIR